MAITDTMSGKKDEYPRAQQRPAGVSPNMSGGTGAETQPTSPPESVGGGGAVQEHRGNALVIGPNIKMKGVEVTDCDTVIVEGQIEASLDSRFVQVKESGLFTGTASMDIAEIWGRFEGELTARKQLIVHPTGSVHGHIRYGKVRVEEGGEVSGAINTLAEAAGDTNSAAAPAIENRSKTPWDTMLRRGPDASGAKPREAS